MSSFFKRGHAGANPVYLHRQRPGAGKGIPSRGSECCVGHRWFGIQ
jgi:hypothetical protein